MSDNGKTESIWKDHGHSAKPHVPISGSILRWAMARSGRGQDDLQHSLPKISKWLNGESRPTLPEVEKLAKATSTPLGFFFLSEPPSEQLPIPHFRTLGNHSQQPSADLIETIQMMEKRQGWMREYLMEQGEEPLSFVRSVHHGDKPEHIASEIRRTLGLSERWAAEQPNWTKALQELRTKIEEAGILLVVNGIVGNNPHRKLDVAEFRGFVLIDEYAPLVFINNADGKAAQMFTLAHELAHIWFGKSAVFDLKELRPANDEIERASNRIAAEFLIPAKQLRDYWPSVKDDAERFESVALHFKVSKLVAAYRTLNLGLIKDDEFAGFYQEYEREIHDNAGRQVGGGDFYANQNLRIGHRFAMAVISAVREGNLLYRDAYNLTGLYGETFENYAKRLGMGGSE
ncbi:MAG: XRE family transcriptional regulator [Methanoregula sp.]|uniref:ImmA/IrrE family metallo-endopeptidase n=1 Tax=Methanoregula sp. TaxID=2052170 RepID=UPI003BB1AEDD